LALCVWLLQSPLQTVGIVGVLFVPLPQSVVFLGACPLPDFVLPDPPFFVWFPLFLMGGRQILIVVDTLPLVFAENDASPVEPSPIFKGGEVFVPRGSLFKRFPPSLKMVPDPP